MTSTFYIQMPGGGGVSPHEGWMKFTIRLSPHPLVQLEPGGEAFAVLILEAEEPGLPQPDRLDYLDVPMGNNNHTRQCSCSIVISVGNIQGQRAKLPLGNIMLPLISLGGATNAPIITII